MAERKGPPNVDGMTTLKVDNISFRATTDMLREVFSPYGEIGDIYIPRNFQTNEPRGFAFVRFAEKKDAEDAQRALDGTDIDGRPVTIQEAKERRPDFVRSGAPRGGDFRGGDRDRNGGGRDDYRRDPRDSRDGGRDRDYNGGGYRGGDRGGDRFPDRGGDRGYDRGERGGDRGGDRYGGGYGGDRGGDRGDRDRGYGGGGRERERSRSRSPGRSGSGRY